jgi:hypothetical protein
MGNATLSVVFVLALNSLMTAEPAAARSRHHRSQAEPAEAIHTKPQDAVAGSQVPLPQPRPTEAPARASAEAARDKEAGKGADKGDGKNDSKNGGKDEAAAQVPPPPSACRLALTEEIAIAPSVPAIHGPGDCGGDDLVRLEAIVLPNKKRVALAPAGIMRCTMAAAVVNWIRDDVAPEVAKLGSEMTTLDNFESYECRGRNGVPGAHLSEHGHANAIDVHGFKLADGRLIDLTDRTQPRDFRETVLHSACTRFPTVLGPDSDWHHEDHIHIDLIERRNNYRICQWDVLDPMPKVAPLIPEVRPDDAPPREVADTAAPAGQAKDQAGAKANDARANDAKANDPKGNDESRPASDKADVGKVDNNKPDSSKAGKDLKQDAKPVTGKVTTESSAETPVTPTPAPPASSAKSSAETAGKDQPESKPAAGSKAATDRSAPAKPSTDKPNTSRTPAVSADQPSPEKPSAQKPSAAQSASKKPSSDKASNEKSSKKIAADRPAPKKRRSRARPWNPFASFF